MHGQYSQAYYTREQRFNDRFPLSIVAVLAVIQMITTFAIIALEIGHNVINVRLTNLFVGFWASVPFTILWISMFAAVCCCRRQSCAVHAIVQNCISFIFAGVVIGINAAFLRRPYQCFFSAGICDTLSWEYSISLPLECFNGNTENCENTRLALIKAQLAAGVVMAVTCFIYLIVYCTVASRANRRQTPTASGAVMASVHQQSSPSIINYQHQTYPNPHHVYPPSAPVMMPAYQQVSPGNSNETYLPTYQYPAMYPIISNDRF